MEDREENRNKQNTPGPEAQETENVAEAKKSAMRKRVHDAESIDTLRTRLYERGAPNEQRKRRPLGEQRAAGARPAADVSRTFPKVERRPERPQHLPLEKRTREQLTPSEARVEESRVPTPPPTEHMPMPKKKRHAYRLKIVLAGVLFLVVSVGLSIMFLLFGNNTISGENITIDISGPFAVGGGEEVPLQIAIANQNAVPIESATLIITYPPGTQSAADPGRELFSERQQLNNINAGELVNVPVRAIVFGEENEEKIITAAVEYRVRGSNATFFKEADPLRFKISSSPVVLSVDSIERVSSGQEVELRLAVSSNSPTPLSDILVKATYPFGFEFEEAEPETVSGQDTWLIETLDPEADEEIVVRGIVTGKENEDRVFSFLVGVPNERDRFSLASIFTKADQQVTIENPFLGAAVTINGDDDETVVIENGESANVTITFTNTLDDSIYDGVVEATLGGNALNEIQVRSSKGFYDSSRNVVTWDSVDMSDLKEIRPGEEVRLNFSLTPEKSTAQTPEVDLTVTVSGQRVYENRVPQKLTNTVARTIKVSSNVALRGSALYSEGPFTNTGPTPPVAETVTQYTILLSADSGSNDIAGAEMTAILPRYITWLDLVTPGDDVSYDSSSRTMTWDIGDMDSNSHEEVWFQVSFFPSLSQVGDVPVILETQRFRATDRFTGTTIRAQHPALSTALVDDPNTDTHDGRVRAE